MITSVMYHYVMSETDMFPGRKGCRVHELEKHLKTASREGEQISLELFQSDDIWKKNLQSEQFIWTFDDGLKEHINNVVPMLNAHNALGVFAVPTKILEKKMLAVHKSHLLISVLQNHFSSRFLFFCDRHHVDYPAVADDVIRKVYRWDDIELARVKYLINYLLKHELVDAILSEMFVEYIGNEKDIAERFYMNASDIAAIASQGHIIAGHSHNHVPLTSLSAEKAQQDLEFNIKTLNDIAGLPAAFSFPYGKKQTYNNQHIETLHQLGITKIFTTEVGNDYFDDFNLFYRLDPKDRFSNNEL